MDEWLLAAEAPGDALAEPGAAVRGALAALRQLSGGSGGELASDLAVLPWPRLRAAEQRLRSRVAEGLTCLRHRGGELGEAWPSDDELRPPWSADLPSRVEAAAGASCGQDEALLDALCRVDCAAGGCSAESCWHCWHLEECGARPPELAALLRVARALAAQGAPQRRAELAERHWPYHAALAAAVERDVSLAATSGRPGTAPQVVVLGGLGVSAVRAALAGAEVQVWEPSAAVARLVRQVSTDNGCGTHVRVVEELAHLDLSAAPALIVLEGLEPDGVLGYGTLEQWLRLAEVLPGAPQAAPPQLLPRSLDFSAALAQARLDAAAAVGLDLSPFADAYGGCGPLPRAAPRVHPCAVPLRVLSDFAPLVSLDLGALALAASGSGGGFCGARLLQLIVSGGTADAVVLRCAASLGEPPAGAASGSVVMDCVHALPARLISRAGAVEVSVSAAWNAHRFWFEVDPSAGFAHPPMSRTLLLDWYSEMMNDAPRNLAFAAGIRQALAEAPATLGAPRRVADLGCGVGVLSLLALRAGAERLLAVEITPHLSRCARRVLAKDPGAAAALAVGAAEVRCADLRQVSCDGSDRFDVVVSELLDAGGLGEKIVLFARHVKCHLLREGGRFVPGRLRIKAALVELRLPTVAGVGLAAFEPFWLPARAAAGEWLSLDLDGGLEMVAVSDAVEVFALDFNASQGDLARALFERELSFPLRCSGRCNAITWWFEADVSDSVPTLTSAPKIFRPAGSEATHWSQAVAGMGPWQLRCEAGASFRVHVRTDGVNLTWTPLDAAAAVAEEPRLPKEVLEAWREAGEEAAADLRALRDSLERMGDLSRLQAVQAAALHIAAQPACFGIEATADAIAPMLKPFFFVGRRSMLRVIRYGYSVA